MDFLPDEAMTTIGQTERDRIKTAATYLKLEDFL
jgi:hypothetical protein